jgi:hypothetical protein
VAIRQLDGFVIQANATDGTQIAQEHTPPPQPPSSGRGCGGFPPPGKEALPPRYWPSPRICDLRDLASFVFERYETGNPIGIVKVNKIGGMPPTTPTYLVVLSGSEQIRGIDQATWLAEDFYEVINRELPTSLRA